MTGLPLPALLPCLPFVRCRGTTAVGGHAGVGPTARLCLGRERRRLSEPVRLPGQAGVLPCYWTSGCRRMRESALDPVLWSAYSVRRSTGVGADALDHGEE